jgi:sterol desaturase/sphingolipid hydroxylase (fatty acid hydroxylase superfamily)
MNYDIGGMSWFAIFRTNRSSAYRSLRHDASCVEGRPQMTITVVTYTITSLMSYYTAAFFQAYLHRLLGHDRIGGPLFRTHTGSHHMIYSAERTLATTYSPDEKSLTAAYLVPTALIGMIGYWALPSALFLVASAAMALSFAAHVYLHAQYHLSGSRLVPLAWFRRKRALHFIHHRDGSANFAIIAFGWDRVMGTYREPTPNDRERVASDVNDAA